MTYTQGMTKVTPKVGKMKKIIHKAAQAGSLIGESLIEDNPGLVDTSSDDQGLASTSKCASIGRCAMGELLFAIGYSNKELRGFSGSGEWDQDVYQELWAEYRIDRKDVDKIIDANDAVNGCSIEDFRKREEKLAKRFDGLTKREKRVNPFLTRLSNGTPLGPLPTEAEVRVLKKFRLYDSFVELAEEQW